MFCRRSPGGMCPLRKGVSLLFEPSGSRFLRLLLHGQPGPSAHQGVLAIFPEIVRRFRQWGVLYHRNRKGRRGQSPGVDCYSIAQRVILFCADRSGGCPLCVGETHVLACEVVIVQRCTQEKSPVSLRRELICLVTCKYIKLPALKIHIAVRREICTLPRWLKRQTNIEDRKKPLFQ
jgi:hypothetical protein